MSIFSNKKDEALVLGQDSLRELKAIKEVLIELIKLNEKKVVREFTEKDFDLPIIQSHPDCIKILDTEGCILFMNYNGLCQNEVDDFLTIRKKQWWKQWGSENEAMVKDSVYRALEGETTSFTALCRTVKGTAKWWEVVVSPLGNPVKQILSVSKDITKINNKQL